MLSAFKDCPNSYRTRPTNGHLASIFMVNWCGLVTSPHSGHIQATAARPHSCKKRAEIFVLHGPNFCRLNSDKLNFKIITEDLPRDKLTAHSIFCMRTKDRAIKIAEMAFFANIFLLRCSLRISLDQNQE